MNPLTPSPEPGSVAPRAPSDASAARALADGWVSHLARWSPRAAPEVLALAHALSLAASAGHVCLQLPQEDRPARIQALLDSGLARMSHTAAVTPLVIDADARVYLARFHDLETRLARRILRALDAPLQTPPRELLAPISGWFETHVDDTAHAQYAAVRMALASRLTLISGGPGTGKTTTLANLLAGLLLQTPDLRIALAAPTGKAAARMLEALAQRTAHLPQDIQAKLPREATTLHRLIAVPPHGGPARFDARHPLPVDVLVIDEASMLDLALATPVLEALPEPARIILLGDRHQLAAVEAGAVFAELSSLSPVLRDQVIFLNRSFRFASDSGIARLAQAARDGQPEQVLAQLGQADLDWIDLERDDASRQIMQSIEAGLQPYLAALKTLLQTVISHPLSSKHLAELEQALHSFRVLCAVRQGPTGTERINAEVSDWIRKQTAHLASPGSQEGWFAGRVVLLTRNDPATGLFNGDLGIALPDQTGSLRVYFPHQIHSAALRSTGSTGSTGSAGSAGSARSAGTSGSGTALGPDAPKGLPIERLPEHDTAFAMTVHKSQGSEFDHILLVLSEARSPILSRELLYTGITRAKRRATLAASTDSLRAATERPTERLSGLADMIVRERSERPAPA